MNNLDQLAKVVIRERMQERVKTRRPNHPRTAQVLRRLAERLDER